ncbi:MAG: hypothetical protein ACOCYT_00640 [Chloroflexota bacterium]
MLKSLPRWVTAAIVFTGLLALVVALNLSPWVRGGYGWRWPYDPADFARALPLVLILTAYMLGAFALYHRGASRWPVLLWAALGSALVAVAVAYAQEGDALYALFTRTASGLTTGQHWAAPRVDWAGGGWQAWPQVMGDLGGHIGTAPPGLIMLYALLNDAIGAVPTAAETLRDPLLAMQCHNYNLLDYTAAQWASAWFGVLLPLWAGLTVLPLYGVASRITHSARDARAIALLWPLVPGVAAFAGSWSTVYPLFAVMAFWPLAVALEQARAVRRLAWAGLSGLVTGLAIFANFALLPLPGLFGFYVLAWWFFRVRGTSASLLDRFGWPVRVGVSFGVGLLLPWLLFWLAGGADPLAILQASFDYHLDLDRPYWFWVFMHVWDFALWAGMGLVLLTCVGVIRWWRQRDGSHDDSAESVPLLALALIATVLVMTISGTTQGESGRIWLFLAPFVLITGWQAVTRLAHDSLGMRQAWLGLAAVHALLALALTVNLAVIGTDFTEPEPPSMIAASTPVQAVYTDAAGDALLQLSAFDAAADDDTVRLTLNWRAQRTLTDVYWFGAQLVGPEGTVTEMRLWQPRELDGRDARYPTTCWGPGAVVSDVVLLPLPEAAAAGEWWVSLAVFGLDDTPEGRLPVVLGDGTRDVQVGLGPVVVSAR